MENNSPRASVSLVRWTRILSIAAVFVFLIGGTVLYRNSKGTLNAAFRTEKKAAGMTVAEAPDAVEEMDAAVMEDAAAVEDTMTGGAVAGEYSTFEETETETDYIAAPALSVNAAQGSEDAVLYDAAPKADSGSMAMLAAEKAYEAEEESAEVYEEASDFTALEAAEAVPLMTAVPTVPAYEPAQISGADPEAAQEKTAEEPEAGFLQNAGAFLTDMGEFLLAALPYLAVLAVPAVIALVIRRKKRQSAG